MNDTIIPSLQGQLKLAEARKLWTRVKPFCVSLLKKMDLSNSDMDIEPPTWLVARTTPQQTPRNILLVMISGAAGESITEARDIAICAAELGFHTIRLPESSFKFLQNHGTAWGRRVASSIKQFNQSHPGEGWGSYVKNDTLSVDKIVVAKTDYPIPRAVTYNRIQAQLSAA